MPSVYSNNKEEKKDKIYDVCRGYVEGLYISISSLQSQLDAANTEKEWWRKLLFWVVVVGMGVNGVSVVATCITMLVIYFLGGTA